MNRADNTVPGGNDRPKMFCIDRPFRFGSDNVINIRSEVADPIPPKDNNFLLLNNNPFSSFDDSNKGI